MINKRNGSLEKLSNKQKYELYKRISVDLRKEIYTDEFKFTNESIQNIDNIKDILDIEG